MPGNKQISTGKHTLDLKQSNQIPVLNKHTREILKGEIRLEFRIDYRA